MQGLRSHPFFDSIRWETLWSDPAPPLEAGLVKKEPNSLLDGVDGGSTDVGAAWDELVASDGQDGDEIRWASDGERPPHEIHVRNGIGAMNLKEEGPMGEIPQYDPGVFLFPKRVPSHEGTLAARSRPPRLVTSVRVSRPPRDSSAGSGTSSETSPSERVGAVLESPVAKRGRPRSPTPVQGNEPSGDSW